MASTSALPTSPASEDHAEGPQKKKAEESQWKRVVAKKRNSGLEYLGLATKKVGEPCQCPLPALPRLEIALWIFSEHWKMADSNAESAYLSKAGGRSAIHEWDPTAGGRSMLWMWRTRGPCARKRVEEEDGRLLIVVGSQHHRTTRPPMMRCSYPRPHVSLATHGRGATSRLPSSWLLTNDLSKGRCVEKEVPAEVIMCFEGHSGAFSRLNIGSRPSMIGSCNTEM